MSEHFVELRRWCGYGQHHALLHEFSSEKATMCRSCKTEYDHARRSKHRGPNYFELTSALAYGLTQPLKYQRPDLVNRDYRDEPT